MTDSNTTATATPTVTVPSADLGELVQRGSAALQEGNLRAALEIFEEVICAFPDRPEGHNNLGALYSALGEFARAEAAFDRVLEILPSNANVLYNRGVVRSRQEKFDSARIDFEAALEIAGQDADIFNNLGVLEFTQGRLKTARKYLRKARRLAPDHKNVMLNLCDVEVAQERAHIAIAMCEEYLARQDDADVRRRLLTLLSEACTQALERASRQAERLVQRDSGDQQARVELGKLIQARTALSAVSDQARA